MDFNFRGTPQEVIEREAPTPPARGRGRPKLGVISREVSLLERHWTWLEAQPSGASATLRRLIDDARKAQPGHERNRRAVTGRVMTALGGDLPGYEEASRALYAGHRERFAEQISAWPEDVRDYVLRLAAHAFPPQAD